MQKRFKNLDHLAQAVWAAPDLATKKKLVHRMVDEFQFKGRQRYFRQQISRTGDLLRLDYLAANLVLVNPCGIPLSRDLGEGESEGR